MNQENSDIDKKCSFVPLHVHTEYSLLDGMSKIPDLVSRLKELGMEACAITDHGVGYGLVEFYLECKKHGIKPILGCEFYVAPGSRFDKTGTKNSDDRYYHLILLVKNKKGYENLCILISRSNTEGFYYKPRIDFELLSQFHEGLICTSACIAGEVARLILEDKYEEAEKCALKYRNLFGDDYYLEVQNHGIHDEDIAYQEIIRIARRNNIKLVCTNDSHYVRSEDAEAHEWLLCLQTQKKITDSDRMIYKGDYSIKSEADMRALYPYLPDAFDNTVEIADKCNFDFEFGNYRMPRVVIPEEYHNDYFKYLSDEAWKGLDKRYPEGHMERENAKTRLNYELDIIKQMGFAEYFLDTRKTILWAHNNSIMTGPGRGSAAGSVMCYCLGITDIDPIKYNLIFERFLNPERVSMPDIDTDYLEERKADVIDFEAKSNGWDHFAKIQTFITMAAKAILRDLVRVAGLPVSVGSKLAGMIPKIPNQDVPLKKAYELNPELREYIQSDAQIQKIWEIALKLEGTKKSASVHACGHIPTPVPCEELFPVSVDSETGYLVCQYNMIEAEHLGNLKKDLLMLRNLTIIDTAIKRIKERHGITVPLWNEEILNDKDALALIASGDTDGVFQLESDGMKSFMRELKPNCFEDIIAGVALYRPGPMDFIPAYIKGKHHPETIKYLTPQLKPILENTYGQIVYQEQVMQIVQQLAGFSMGRADVVRKAMGKKKMDIMMAEREKFIYGYHEDGFNIPGCIANGIPKEIAETIYDQMIDFAKYAFNKSHAAAYAAIAMQTAYLKAHYPLEFASGLLTSVMGKTEKLAVYVNEYKKKGHTILPPDVNTSQMSFTVSGDSICYGLASIKGIGEGAAIEIIKEREANGPYTGFADFIKRNLGANKRVIESIIKAGGLDFTEYTRKAMLTQFESVINTYKTRNKNDVPGQMSFLDFVEKGSADYRALEPVIENCEEYSDDELLAFEKEATGFYISKHPMDSFGKYLEYNKIPGNELFIADENGDYPISDDCQIKVAGIITGVRNIYTKKNEPMAFVTIEDQVSSVDIVVFPRVYQRYYQILQEDKKIVVCGKTSIDDKGASVLADRIVDLDNIPNDLWVRVGGVDAYRSAESIFRKFMYQHRYDRFNSTGEVVNLITSIPQIKQFKIEGQVEASEKMYEDAKKLFKEENISLFNTLIYQEPPKQKRN